MAHLAGITIYPIKSLDGVSVASARVTSTGGLEWDRRLAICDSQGKFINGKRTPAVHSIRTSYAWDPPRVTLTTERSLPESFSLEFDRARMADWLSTYFGFEVGLVENADGGFPDDTDAAGPTVISTSTIATVASWFADLSLDEVRRRFRANLEVDEVPAFWEDSLYGTSSGVPWRFGEVVLIGRQSSQRCVVPSRCSRTGAAISGFARIFATQREQSLPSWAPREKFNHFYRLATNTSVLPETAGKTLRVGDPVERL